MKIIRKIILYLLLGVAVPVIALLVSAILFKDQIINRFIQQANQQLNTPVKIGKIEVSVVDHFPRFAIVFTDVYVEDSHAGQYPLLTAAKVSFQLNPFEVYRGHYTVLGLQVSDCETNLKINARGENNYTIVKASSESSGEVEFDLRNVSLLNCRVRYLDLDRKDDLVFYTEKLQADIHTANQVYDILARGSIVTEKIQLGTTSVLEGKKFTVTTNLLYNDAERSLSIQPSELGIGTSVFSVQGDYRWKEPSRITLSGTGKNTTIQTLLSLLPEKVSQKLSRYQSKGDAYFILNLDGEISKTKSPALKIDFGLNNATILHPEYKTSLQDVSLQGSFHAAQLHQLTASSLVLQNMRGKMNEKAFEANFAIKNFTDPEIIFDFSGEMDITSLLNFYPVEALNNASGTVLVNVSFEGKTAWLKKRNPAQQASTLGTIELTNVSLLYGKDRVPLTGLSGVLQFNHTDLALSNVAGKLGDTDFILNGYFKNAVTNLLLEDQPVAIEADLKSKYINLDQLFAFGFGTVTETNSETTYTFNISKNLNLKFNCDVQRLTYKKFNARNLKGDLLITNSKAISKNIALNSLGGSMLFTGSIDAKNPKANSLSCAFLLKDIHIDSAFYVFENFQQNFLVDKNLKGQADAHVMLDVVLNQNLRIFPETLTADIITTIRNGELNQFEPLKKLDKYLDDESLNAIRFADLKNEIHIEKNTIYIPQMEVKTNVSVMQISGTHQFDQRIDYRIVTPLNNKRKINLAEATGAIEEMEGRSKLFLKITGTTNDYRVQYDTDAVKRKIASDLKKEVQELKDLFKKKQKKKEAELSKEEFDWEN